MWNDGRTESICDRLAEQGGKDRFRATTGLPIAPYFSATKLMHLLDSVPGLRADAEAGEALFGTMDTYLIWKLTEGAGAYSLLYMNIICDFNMHNNNFSTFSARHGRVERLPH